MARPLWRELGTMRAQAPPETAAAIHRTRFVAALVAFVIALAALTVSSVAGDLHSKHLRDKVITLVCAAVFLVFSVAAVRAVASSLGAVVSNRGGHASASAVRLITTIAGYLIVLTVTLGILDVPVQHLLLGGAITGVILGIAAQQALGNVFAGLVLLLARPFVVGQHIRIRSGSYGGELNGVVLAMSLTYVTIETESGLLKVPNAGMLASAVGPYSSEAAGAALPSAADVAKTAAAAAALVSAAGTRSTVRTGADDAAGIGAGTPTGEPPDGRPPGT